MGSDTYVYGQCADAVRGVMGRTNVFIGIEVDDPRVREDQASCTIDIVKCSVLATYKVGGKGAVFFPPCGVDFSNLTGALKEFGLK